MNRRLIVTFFMLTVLLVLSCGTYAHATPSQDKVILSCDKLGFFNNSDTNISLQTDKEQIKEGEAAWVCKRVSDFIFETKIVPVDISEYEQGGIRLWFYAEDVNAFLNREVELWLTSSGSNEQDGYCWNLGSQLRTSGWQDIYLLFKEAARYGEPDLSAVNYLLLYSGGFNTTVMVDDIRASMRGADYMSAKNPFGAQNGCGVVIVNTKYSTTDVVVADIIATDAAYGADSSGREDSTLAIQSALDACSALGGGTVWLPEGSYLVTDTIVVPPYCALRGDWQDPDAAPQGETLGYGTVILARPHTLETPDAACSQGLFEICGAAGVMGLTVYYPDQSLDAPKAYPYAFYSSNGVNVGRYDPWSTDLMPSVQNCTVINGWMGIGTAVTGNNPQEYIIIENVNGTFLSTAVNMRKSMDVSSLKNVTVSNSYWAEAKESFNPPDRAALDGYTRKNAVGIMLREMEATELVNVSISDRSVGVYLADSAGTGNSARIFDLRITSCDTGIKADNIDLNWNVVITKGDIEGSLFAIENKTGGIIKLSGVTLTGDCYCEPTGDIVTQGADLDGVVPDYQACPAKPKQILYEACLDVGYGSDQSRRLQSVLDEAGRTGGVVYVRAGIYRLDNPVRVPAGVELRGASSVPVRNMDTLSYGTALYSYYGLDCDNPDRQPALITLEGENAGVRGMRIVCPQGRRPDYGDTAYAVRGTARGVYCVNCCISASGNGVDFRGCDNHFIKRLYGCGYFNTIKAGGKNGFIEGCLQNPNTVFYGGDDYGFVYLGELNALEFRLRETSSFITLEDSRNETVLDVFTIVSRSMIDCKNSKNTLIVNACADISNSCGTVFSFRGGDATLINAAHYYGFGLSCDDCRLNAYNRMSFQHPYECDWIGGKPTAKGRKSDVRLTNCNDKSCIVEGGEIWDGERRCVRFADYCNNIVINFSPVDISHMEYGGALELQAYVKDVGKLPTVNDGELMLLTNGGALRWYSRDMFTRSGWQKVRLPLDGSTVDGEVNLSEVYGLYLGIQGASETVVAIDDVHVLLP